MTFDCDICKEKFTSRRALAHHVKKIHEQLRYECQECDELFTEKGAVRRHVKGVHKGVKYECDICDLKFSYANSVSKHKNNVHFKTNSFGPKTLTETIFSKMVECNTGWECMQRGYKSKSKDKKASKVLVKAHIESEHMKIIYTCEMCGLAYRSRDSYKRHAQTTACNFKISE